jgi:diguanylate cyclase (GGDEF)-like protein/PAS domain S-box-containing protein
MAGGAKLRVSGHGEGDNGVRGDPMRHRDRFLGDADPGTGHASAGSGVSSNGSNGTNGTANGSTNGSTNGHREHLPEVAFDSFAQIVDHSPDAICIHQDGRFVYFNAVAVRWLGAHTAHEIVGHAVSRFVHARSIPLLLARVSTLRNQGDVSAPSRATVVRLDGSELHVEAVSVMTTWRGAVAYQLIFRDLTEHRAAHDTLVHQAALVDHANDAIISITRTGMVTSWNPAAERIYRRPAHRALAHPVDVAVGAPVDVTAIAAAGGVVHSSHYAMDGSVRIMRVSATEFDNGYVLLCSDETALRRAARNLRTVVNTLQEGVVVVDQNGWLLTINPAARRILGLGPSEQHVDHGDRLRALPVYDSDGVLLSQQERPVTKTFATGLPIIGRVFGLDRPDGRRVWLSTSCQLLHPDSRDHSPVLVSFTDITSQRAATELLAHQAAHDVLTGLPNRAHILETVNALQRDGGMLNAVLFIDLDDLKTVNDTFGHDVGDTVIQACADRLRRTLRRHDIVGRFAGDEFVALLIGELNSGGLERSVERIHRVLTEPIEIPGGTLQLGASIGVVKTAGHDNRDAAALLRDADAAMYAAKASGRRASIFSGLRPPQP